MTTHHEFQHNFRHLLYIQSLIFNHRFIFTLYDIIEIDCMSRAFLLKGIQKKYIYICYVLIFRHDKFCGIQVSRKCSMCQNMSI